MKYLSLLLVPLAMSAHAEMIYPKGTRATVTAEYSYQSAGETRETPSNPESVTWRAKRAITVTATLSALAPIGVPTMHKQEKQQKAQVEDMQKRSEQIQVQTAPLMDAAMAAFEKCGEDEACLEREAQKMSGAMEKSDVKGARENVTAITASAATMTTPRYQQWEPVSQAPSPYTIDEEKNVRSREPGCERNPKATCTTQETLKGAGTLAGASNQGSAMFEVDSKNGDIALALPFPNGILQGTFTRATDNPDLEAESSKKQIVFPDRSKEKSGSASQPLLVSIKDLRAASGTLTIPTTGEFQEKGTLTIKWRIMPL